MPLGESNAPGYERVLRRTVDEWDALKDRSDREDGRGRHLVVRGLDGVQEIVCGVIHAREDVGEALRVGGPEDDELLELIVGLERADVSAELVEVDLLVVSGKEVVRTFLLVGGDEVWVVDGGEGLDRGHKGNELALEVPGEDLGTLHSGIERGTRDVPPADDKVIGVHGREDRGEGDVDIFGRGGVDTETNGRSTEDRANVVGRLDALLGAPSDVMRVGEDRGGQSGAIVATKANHHQAIGERRKTGEWIASSGRKNTYPVRGTLRAVLNWNVLRVGLTIYL